MKSKKSIYITGLSLSLLFLGSPAYAGSGIHKATPLKTVVAHSLNTYVPVTMSATLAEFYLTNFGMNQPTPAVTSTPIVQTAPPVTEPTVESSPAAASAVAIPTSAAPVTQPAPVASVSETPVPAATTPTPVVSPPVVSAPTPQSTPAPVVTSPVTPATPNGSDYADNGIIWCSVLGHIPDLGQSCQLPIATTDYSMPTSVVYAPNTLSFTAVPSASNVVVDNSGNSVYTPTFAAGTPEAGPITVTASGSCSSDGTTVIFTGNNCAVTISQPGAAPVTQVIQVLPASTEPQS
jgi:hypothetical protein